MMRDGRKHYRIVLLKDPERGAVRMSCSDANCQNAANGWATVLDPQNEKHVSAARWIEGDSGRKYLKLESATALEYVVNHRESLGLNVTEGLMRLLENTPAGMLVFLFPPGQSCFKVHVDREVVFARDQYVHTKPLDFNEDMNESAYRYYAAVGRG